MGKTKLGESTSPQLMSHMLRKTAPFVSIASATKEGLPVGQQILCHDNFLLAEGGTGKHIDSAIRKSPLLTYLLSISEPLNFNWRVNHWNETYAQAVETGV